MALFNPKGQFNTGIGNPQMRTPSIPRLKIPPGPPEQPPGTPQPYIPGVSLGKPPSGLWGSGGGGGGFMTGGGGGGSMSADARNAMNLAKHQGDQMKQWLQQLAYGQGPFAKLMIDPSKAINAAMPGITEKMTGDFNEAANRLGATGMLGFSQGKMAAGTPYQDLLGQAAKSSNLAREEIRSKYQFEADKANQDTMLALMDKLGISGGGGGGGGGWNRGAMESAAQGGGGGDPTRDPSSIWYNDAAGYKAYLAKQKTEAIGENVGKTKQDYATGYRDGVDSGPGSKPPAGMSDEYTKGFRAGVKKSTASYRRSDTSTPGVLHIKSGG